MSKIIFVLIKVDIISYFVWLLVKIDRNWGMFVLSKVICEIFEKKVEYY